MTWWEAALVLLAGVGAGTINTIVGSGTLITFPTLLALGLPPVTANISNCIGLAIGGSSGVWGYRRELVGLGSLTRTLVPLCVAGAAGGALLLLVLPAEIFEAVVPVLIAAALVLVVLQPRIARALRRDEGEGEPDPDVPMTLSRRRTVAVRSGVAATGVYGGYFGAAQGVLLVGMLGTLLPIGLQPVNALKNVLGTSANATAAVTFVLLARDQIDWAVVVLIMLGSLAGGFIGAHIGRRLSPPVLRAVIVVVGVIALVKIDDDMTAPVERVTEVADPRLADYVGLTDVALRRRTEPERGLYMAESDKVIRRALEAGHLPRSLLLSDRWLEPLGDLVERVRTAGGIVFVGTPDVLHGITGFNVHRGAIAAMHRPALPPVAELIRGARRVVVLEDIVDHTNVGAIFRGAAGLGVDAVLVSPRCADPLYRRSVRVSMGTVFQVPWTKLEPWPDGLDVLRENGFTVAAMALTPAAVSLDEVAAGLAAGTPSKLALMLGAEGDGLTVAALEAADLVVRIPMSGGVDSLNVAAAAAVAFWATRPALG